MKTLVETEDRKTLTARLLEARARIDDLFQVLRPEALYERPIPERHRLVFYLGHLEAFDWNLIARQGFGVEPFREEFDRLFAFGIDPVDGGLPSEPASAWPRRDQVEEYNRRVRDVVDECFRGERKERGEYEIPTLFHMAIEHRLMHAETLAYLLHQLPYESKMGRKDPVAPPAQERDELRQRIEIPGGIATLGRSRESGLFGWDNEFGAIRAEVPGFSIDRQKVTNGDYLEFVQGGGYRNRSLWSEEGWAWKERHHVEHPAFWSRHDGDWRHRGMFSESPLPPMAPVSVSHAEATAFARWAGGELPTEAQFHRAAYGTPGGEEREYPWGDDPPTERRGNFDFRRWETTPVGTFPESASAFGVEELVGNGWEWTRSRFEPFPGFEAHPLYRGYSADFFDGRHYVLKGASPRTASCFLRRSFRNWFQPCYPYVYAAFRLVRG
jgi:gamma-glutamyl hercynylcysteine S-oxide synthase